MRERERRAREAYATLDGAKIADLMPSRATLIASLMFYRDA